MAEYRSFVKHLIVPALAAAVLGAAALGGGTAGAAAPPLALKMGVYPGGTEATVQVAPTDSVLITVRHTVRRVTGGGVSVPPTRIPISDITPALSGGVATLPEIHETPVYVKEARIKLTNLQPNTTYEVVVSAGTAAGQTATARQTFTTLKQRVRITLREINITDDGDGFLTGDGEPSWVVSLRWAGGSVAGCYPNTDVGFGGVCQFDSRGSGTFFPTNNRGDSLKWIFAQENFDQFPAQFEIGATAEEDDFLSLGALTQILEDCILDGIGCGFSNTVGPGPWKVPQGVDWASTAVRVRANDDSTGFESELTFTFELFHDNLSYPSARNAPSSTWRAPFGR